MLHIYFKQTMDRFGVKGAALAKAFGCSRNHISEIRNGKCNPPINRFWELIETMESLAPGSKSYFAGLMVQYESPFSLEPMEMIRNMDNNQLSAMLCIIADVLKNDRKSTVEKKAHELLAAS